MNTTTTAAAAAQTPAADPIVYVTSGYLGAFPNSGPVTEDGAIHVFTLGQGPGGDVVFTPLETVEQGGSFPLWLCTDAAKRFLYVADAPNAEAHGKVHAYGIAADGKLSHLNHASTVGTVPCHLEVVGKTLLACNFVGGNVLAIPIKDDGTLGSVTSVHAHAPSPEGPTPHTSGRQATAHPHMVLPDPTGKFVFVPDLGTNSVVTYTLDSDASILTRSSELHLHPGAGPRHLALSPTAPFAYCINEIDNTVTSLRYDAASGTLSLLAGVAPVNLLPDGTAHRNGGGAAEITISNDGRFAYASVRTTGAFNASEAAAFNQIAVLRLNRESGGCSVIQNVDSGGSMPWSHTFVGIDDSILLVQNQHSKHTGLPEAEGGDNDGHNGLGPGKVAPFRRDKQTGLLKAIGKAAEVPQAMSVLVLTRD